MTKNEAIHQYVRAEAKIDRLNAENAELRADLEKAVQRQSEIMDEMDAMYSPKVVALQVELKRVTEARDSLQVLFGELDDSWENRRKKWLAEVETQCQRAENAERALNIATTDKEMALKELGVAREQLNIWRNDERARYLAERTRCAEIAKAKGDKWRGTEIHPNHLGEHITAAIMEEPK